MMHLCVVWLCGAWHSSFEAPADGLSIHQVCAAAAFAGQRHALSETCMPASFPDCVQEAPEQHNMVRIYDDCLAAEQDLPLEEAQKNALHQTLSEMMTPVFKVAEDAHAVACKLTGALL